MTYSVNNTTYTQELDRINNLIQLTNGLLDNNTIDHPLFYIQGITINRIKRDIDRTTYAYGQFCIQIPDSLIYIEGVQERLIKTHEDVGKLHNKFRFLISNPAINREEFTRYQG